MPCRTELFRCNLCGGEHYYMNECKTDPSKYREGLAGYDPKTAEATALNDGFVPAHPDNKPHRINVAGALCDVLTALEDRNLLKMAGVPQDVLDWWAAHQSKEQDKIKQEALAKLSEKEKRALGLK